MTEQKVEIKIGDVYEDTVGDCWGITELVQNEEGVYERVKDRPEAHDRINTIEILKKDIEFEGFIDLYLIKFVMHSGTVLEGGFGKTALHIFVKDGSFRLLARNKTKAETEDEHAGMFYNEYNDTWHWGIF